MKCSELAFPLQQHTSPLTSLWTMHKLLIELNMQSTCSKVLSPLHKLLNMQYKYFKVQSQSLMKSNDMTFRDVEGYWRKMFWAERRCQTPFKAKIRFCAYIYVSNFERGRNMDRLKLLIRIRLTYNCAHLRSTKESLTFEYFDTGRYWLVLGQYRTVRVDIW